MKHYKRKYNTPEYRKRYTGIYGSWYAMKQRCGNPKNSSFHNYGGRGITYDPKWESFTGFQEDMGGSYSSGLTLERIDVNGNYNKQNCCWITRKQQYSNMRKTVWLEYKGETKTLMDWAKEIDLPYKTVRSRYYRKMPTRDILRPSLFRPAKI